MQMISTDAYRMDMSAMVAHDVWLAPIQIVVGVVLLLYDLGPSALVGLWTLMLAFPIQFYIVRAMYRARTNGVKITDDRVRLTGEVLQVSG